jgi:hypothetical protein
LEPFEYVSQGVSLHALSSRAMKRCRRVSCVDPGIVAAQMWSVQPFISAFFGASLLPVHGRAICAAAANASRASRHPTPIA